MAIIYIEDKAVPLIEGAKGGGGAPYIGKEDPNTLFSTDILFITLGIGEGPLYRINPNGPQDIEFNEGNIDDLLIGNSINSETFYTISNNGNIAQQKLHLFGDYTFIPQRLQGAVELKKGNEAANGIPASALTKQNTSELPLTAIKGYFIINSLMTQTDQGDIKSNKLSVKVTVYDRSGTTILNSVEKTVEGKTMSAFSFDIFVAIPPDKVSNSGYKFTVQKTSDDTTSAKQAQGVSFQGWTEMIEEPIAYTRTATIGYALKAFAEHKGGLPVMTSLVKGLLVKVPSNYNQPILENGDIDWRQIESDDNGTSGYYLQKTGLEVLHDANPLIYDGLWDGQFIYSWTQNPAWIIYDMLTNTTYGLGIPENHIDKYSFYDVAIYCDACDVTTGRFLGVSAQADGTYRYKPRGYYTEVENTLIGLPENTNVRERRFILDAIISDQKQVMDIINVLTLTFRGILFYTGGKISLYQDKPDNMPVAIFNETNIIAGTMNIAGVGEESLLTGVDISYNEVKNHYRREVLRIDDQKALTERNYIENVAKVDLAGITRKSHALRLAQYLIAESKYSRRKIGFKTGIEASDIVPGSIISVSQRASSVSWGFGGIVSNTSGASSSRVYLEHIGNPPISSIFFTANTKPLALRIASGNSSLIDTYIISNTVYSLSSTSNVSGGAEVIGVRVLSKYSHPSKSFTAYSGSWGANHIPSRHDIWTLGEINDPTNIYTSLSDKLFKVINVKRDKDETVFIEGREYISNVYIDSDRIINYKPLAYTDFYTPLKSPPVPNFSLRTVPKRDFDGSVYTDIEINSYTDLTGYTGGIQTEFYHSKPNESYTVIANTSYSASSDIIKLKVNDFTNIVDGQKAMIYGKNGFTTEIGVSKLLVTAAEVVDRDNIFKPNGNIQLTISGFGGLVDTNFVNNVHVLTAIDTFEADGLKGRNVVGIPIVEREQSGVGDGIDLKGFIGYNPRVTNFSSTVQGFNPATNTLKISNEGSSSTLFNKIPTPPFYISLSQIIDYRHFSRSNTIYVTGTTNETIRTNVATTTNISDHVFKQPLGVAVRHKAFVDVFVNGNKYDTTSWDLEKGLDNLANSQVVINLTTVPITGDTGMDIRVVANNYSVPIIEIGDKISWATDNTYVIKNTSYDPLSPKYNAYLTANSIYRVELAQRIKSNVSATYAINISPDPIGTIGNVNSGAKTVTFDYESAIYNTSLNLGNNSIYLLNIPLDSYEPLSFSDSTSRIIPRAEKGFHSVKARTVNKLGRRSAFVTNSITVLPIPIMAVKNLLVTEELYKDSSVGVSTRAIVSFDHITGQEVTDYEISYKIVPTGSDGSAYTTIKVAAQGVEADGKIKVKIENIERGLSSASINELIVRVIPLNRLIRGSPAVVRQEIQGKRTPPLNVVNFVVGQVGEALAIFWQYVKDQNGNNVDIDLKEVHIRRIEGAIDTDSQNTLNTNWAKSSPLVIVAASDNKVTPAIDSFGTATYLVKTKDTSGNFCENVVGYVYNSVGQLFNSAYKVWSEDDPAAIYVPGIQNANYNEHAFASFYSSNNYGFPSITFNASTTDNANGSSTGWSVINDSPSDLRCLGDGVYRTSIRDVGVQQTSAAIVVDLLGFQSIKSTWLDYAEIIGEGAIVEDSSTVGTLKDINFSGALGIGNILGYSNTSAATVTYNNENKTLGSGSQSGYPSNVFAITTYRGNYDGDDANANILSLIAGVSSDDTIVLGKSWFANGYSTGSNGWANLRVAGSTYRLVNLKQWLDLPESATYYGTLDTIEAITELRITTSDPYLSNGTVNNSAFTSTAGSEGFFPLASGAKTFQYFQLQVKILNKDPQQAEYILDKFRYKVLINEKTFTDTVTVPIETTYIDYSRMAYTRIPKITALIVSASSDQFSARAIIRDRGITGANISVYFANGISAHNILGPGLIVPAVEFGVTGV
jgi:hypothetical protein